MSEPTEPAPEGVITEECELVVRSLLGDLDAFDELVRRYRGAVIAIARAVVGSREAAEDVAQDAFLTAFKALPQLAEPERFGPWLYAITRHRGARVARQSLAVRPADPSELDRILLEHSTELARDPEAERQRHERDTELWKAIRELPVELRSVIVLRYFEEWPVLRIAEFLALPITTVKWRLHQGRLQLRRSLTAGTGEDHVRTIRYRPRSTPPAAHAPGNREARPRSEPHRQPAGRGAQLGPPI